jgi:hypothetical protein
MEEEEEEEEEQAKRNKEEEEEEEVVIPRDGRTCMPKMKAKPSVADVVEQK